MAIRTVTTYFDDIDGSVDGVKSVRFSVDGKHYEIDLSQAHAKELHTALRRFTAAGRRISAFAGTAGRRSPVGSAPVGRDYDPKAVRAWASANGHEVLPRGRVPEAVIQAYRQSQHAF